MKKIHVDLIPFVTLAVILNSLSVLYAIFSERGGDVTVGISYFIWDLLIFICIWLFGIITLAIIAARPDNPKGTYYNLIKIIAIAFCTPIPFILFVYIFSQIF